ncbi:MAG: mechanosensitive ion channel family protein [Flavobacteriales bacterium]
MKNAKKITSRIFVLLNPTFKPTGKLTIKHINFMDNIQNTLSTALDSGVESISAWAPRLLGAFVALFIGFLIVRMLLKMISKAFDRTKLDDTLRPFLITSIGFALKALLFITVASVIGIKMTSFAALIASVGLAIGLAFQGSLGNLASGVMILIFKPFKVGDLIEVGGQLGFVKEVSVFVTFLNTFQNKTVIIPNGKITADTVTNFSSNGNVRADIPFAVRYDADHQKAQEIVQNILDNSPLVLKDPKSSVYITNLGESSVELVALPFCTVDDYWDVFWGLRGEIKKQLSEAGFDAPFKQIVLAEKK